MHSADSVLSMAKILLVEDDTGLRTALTAVLQQSNYGIVSVPSAEEALTKIVEEEFALVLSDYRLVGENGLWLLQRVRELSIDLPFVLMTAYGSIEMAVKAIKIGANDYLTKPFDPPVLLNLLSDLLKYNQVVNRCDLTLKKRQFLTVSSSALELLRRAEKAARYDSTVLITGESGTGKELIAQHIHYNSSRRDHPFCAVNCAAMPAELLESELFGHTKGAFTGATQARKGLFEFASKGTLFLDEVGDMPNEVQVKLLRVLQEHEIRPLGSSELVAVAPRIIAATNVNLIEALRSGKIREDFYFRLAVVPLEVPALRERPEDIEYLSERFVNIERERSRNSELRLSNIARRALRDYPWPGNVRELENVIQRAAILTQGEILPEHLGINSLIDLSSLEEASFDLRVIALKAARLAEQKTIERALLSTKGNKSEAARLLGVSYKTLLNKLKEVNIQPLS